MFKRFWNWLTHQYEHGLTGQECSEHDEQLQQSLDKFRKEIIKYGYNKTIHRSKYLNVETDKTGKVVAVWFRCMRLPFKQSVVDKNRVKDLEQTESFPLIMGIDLLVDKQDGY